MRGRSWHRGCPVAIDDLRLVRVRHWDFRGNPRRGRLIVHEDSAKRVLKAFWQILRKHFPIRRMRAIDLNPIENPYVTPSGHVSSPAGKPFADRSRNARGMLHGGDPAIRAFARIGWKWGGRWPGTKDYQHLSASGS